MKLIIFGFLLVIILAGCEPGYRIYIRNNASTTLYLKTSPSIESLYPKWTGYQDSIIAIKTSQEGRFALYSIKPFNTLRVWDNVGNKPTSNQMPYDYIEVISGTDTLILNSKEKIIEQLKQGSKKFDYYIEMVK